MDLIGTFEWNNSDRNCTRYCGGSPCHPYPSLHTIQSHYDQKGLFLMIQIDDTPFSMQPRHLRTPNTTTLIHVKCYPYQRTGASNVWYSVRVPSPSVFEVAIPDVYIVSIFGHRLLHDVK